MICELLTWRIRGNILHARNQHLRNHRGFSVACPDGFPVASSNMCFVVSGIFQRIVTCPVEFYWKCPMDCKWHFPIEVHSVISGVKYFALRDTARSRKPTSEAAARVKSRACRQVSLSRGNILHTRNRHLRNHRAFPVSLSNGCSAAFSNLI